MTNKQINSWFIMCIRIIRNNSLVGERASLQGWARTLATERVTLYCTWRPSARTTQSHGQVIKCEFTLLQNSVQCCHVVHSTSHTSCSVQQVCLSQSTSAAFIAHVQMPCNKINACCSCLRHARVKTNIEILRDCNFQLWKI